MNYVEDYFDFMKTATTAVQSIDTVKKRLEKAGFESLSMGDLWTLEPGGCYLVSPYPSMTVAFTMGKSGHITKGFHVVTAHTDNPALHIKPEAEVVTDGMMTLNVEKYGGPILNSWFDRPLSIAGRVAVRSENIMKPVIHHVDLKKPILTLPSLAIHMNREVNKGVEIKIQKDMQPLIADQFEEAVKSKKDYLVGLIAKEIGVEVLEILDMDLYVYCAEEGYLVGEEEAFMSCPRIDDLSMVYAALTALIEKKDHQDGINMALFFDNEEIGSATRQGADSSLIQVIMERIRMGMNRTEEQFIRQWMDSFVISADGAHALHPNYTEKNDPTNRPVMNNGITIKLSASKAYASEVDTTSVVQQLCDEAKIPYQKFVNHSDQLGGKTLGPILNRYFPVPTVDLGVPMLAMHSTRELMGKQDFLDSVALFQTFYSTNR